MSLVRQPVRSHYEISPEVAKCISWLRRRLLCWFARNGRSFPWRESGRTPYEVVVAEILLQRTTAAAVARSYSGFIERFPSWASLAQYPLEELENALRPLGLWRRKAQAFQHLAQSFEANNGVPCTRKELERLPGIGPYTASTVLALVYGRAEPLLDVNMARVLGRFLGPPKRLEAKPKRTLHAHALRLVRRSKSALEVNWAVLDFGALVCRARRPLCPECPLRARCQYAMARHFQPTSSAGAL